jgi:hypothetical protein
VRTYPDPARKNGAYKWFVEELLEIAAPSNAAWVQRHGHLERMNDADVPLKPEESRRKEFFLRLDASEREMLGRMLDETRRAAVHDVCSFWKTVCLATK